MKEICIGEELYPKNLKTIPDSPEKLFVEGNVNLLESIGIAVIGTRHPSDYGKRMCKRFTKELVQYGVTIVSGMAQGIDTIAHKTCLENGGNTIAVLPCGLGVIYPKSNNNLYKDILNLRGAVITEYPPNEEPKSKRFLERNRIVSGLSVGTLVIEAGYRSGTSVTARISKEQGRKVFSIPSSLDNRRGITSNEIIQKGGKLVTCVEDILEEFKDIDFVKNEEMDNINYINEDCRELYSILNYKPQHINYLVKKLNSSISDVNYKLMMLELDDYITALPGNFYIRK